MRLQIPLYTFQTLALGLTFVLTPPFKNPDRLTQQKPDSAAMAAVLASAAKQNDLPAIAGAIVTSKGLVAVAGVGTRKRGQDVPVTIDDEWHLGSDTKAMTSVIAAWLVEHGKLKWDSTIAETFSDMAGRFSPEFASITLVELLSHHAGLPENINWHMPAFSGPILEQRKRAVDEASKTMLLSKPGTQYQYSNLGYVIVGAMEERVTGKPWEELIAEIIFRPLGMASAGFGGTGTPGKVDQPWGHTANGNPVIGNGPAVDNPPVMGPAGRVHCTVQDWGKFITDQLRGALGQSALLKPESYKKLHEPPFDGNYALGWLVVERPWGGGTVYTHSGSNTMNYAVVWMAPKRDFAVLVVSNQGGAAAEKGCDQAAGGLIRLSQKG